MKSGHYLSCEPFQIYNSELNFYTDRDSPVLTLKGNPVSEVMIFPLKDGESPVLNTECI